MSVYYDDLVLAGTAYRGPSFTQDDSGWADDIVFVPSFVSTSSSGVVASGAGYAAGVGTAQASSAGDEDTVITLGARRARVRERLRLDLEAEEFAAVLEIAKMVKSGTIH